MTLTLDPDILRREQRFFDDEAAGLSDAGLRIAPGQLERYKNARLRADNIPKDALFARLLPVAGKRVLEYGCGHGENACHLANCGAEVTAFDLSPLSVARARRRAELHGLADRIHFDVAAAGQLDYPPARFDVVTGFAILHHLHQMLDVVYAEIDRLLKPDGAAYFIEPVANSPALRWLRRRVPVPPDATPDERQLTYADFDPLRRYFGKREFYHFYCLERLQRLFGGRGARPLRRLDHHLQRVAPFLRRYYGIVLVIARR